MLAPWKKSYDKLRQHIKNQRHYFADKVLYSQSYGLRVVTYRHESWIIKKAECWRIDAFKLWCQTRLLRVHWTGRRSNQWILKEIKPEYSLEGLMLKLRLQYFGHLMWKADLVGKDPDSGKVWGQVEKWATEDEMTKGSHQLNGHEFEQTLGESEGQKPGVLYAVHGATKSRIWLCDWTTATTKETPCCESERVRLTFY